MTEDKSIQSNLIQESWSFAEGEYNGLPLMARVNKGLQPFIGHQKYQYRVGIAVPFHSVNDFGLPTGEESWQVGEIEDLLFDELSIENESLLAIIITTNGMREFVFYTMNPTNVEQRIELLKDKITSHALQIMIQHDPEWNVYRQFL